MRARNRGVALQCDVHEYRLRLKEFRFESKREIRRLRKHPATTIRLRLQTHQQGRVEAMERALRWLEQYLFVPEKRVKALK